MKKSCFIRVFVCCSFDLKHKHSILIFMTDLINTGFVQGCVQGYDFIILLQTKQTRTVINYLFSLVLGTVVLLSASPNSYHHTQTSQVNT